MRSRRRTRLLGFGVACLAWPAGCGGKVQGGGSASGGAAGASTVETGAAGAGFEDPSHPLGTCHPGTLPAAGQPCPWLANGLCYSSVDDACNCVCPRDRASVCASGFPGGTNGQVLVTCS